MPRSLSKADFKAARSCGAKLYFRENGYPDNREHNPYLELIADGGYMVEALARARYPDGIQLYSARDVEADFKHTLDLLDGDATLFEATVLAGRRHARIDILVKTATTVRVIEVKSKSFDGAAHAASLARGGHGVFRAARPPYALASGWVETIEDVAYQTLLLQEIFPHLTVTPYLALVDTSKVAGLDGVPTLFELESRPTTDGGTRAHTARYVGTPEQLALLDLVTEVDVSNEVALVRDDVLAAAELFEARLDAPLDVHLADVERGAKCRDCEFRTDTRAERSGFRDCWGPLADAKPHVLELYRAGRAKAPDGTPLVTWMFDAGRASLLDVPHEGLVRADGSVGAIAERQRRQIDYTRRGETFVGRSLRSKIDALRSPLYFIDFEGSQLALPYHKGMRPYGKVAFQWSCHIQHSPGERPAHSEWLNNRDVWPNQAFAASLREAIGDEGPVLTWSGYERDMLRQISADLERFGQRTPALTKWIDDVVSRRIVDLHEWAQEDYFHPRMGARTSIKAVLDAIWSSDPEMRRQFEQWTGLEADASRDPYASLPPVVIAGVAQNVHEGTGAMRAYQEMMYGSHRRDPGVQEAWAQLLRQYCRMDTLSMVLILEHWRRMTARV